MSIELESDKLLDKKVEKDDNLLLGTVTLKEKEEKEKEFKDNKIVEDDKIEMIYG